MLSINRNIVECKLIDDEWENDERITVLIETLWNVNMHGCRIIRFSTRY